MKNQRGWLMVVLLLAVTVGAGFGGQAAAGTLIPDHSVGWNELTPRLRKEIHGLQREVRALKFTGVRKRLTPVPIPGPQGERGETGPQGLPGRDVQPPAEPEANSGFVQSESVTAVGGSSAILEAVLSTEGRKETINWLGEVYPQPDEGLYYQFQLATDPANFRPEVSCPEIDAPVGCFGAFLHHGSGDYKRQAGDLPTRGILPGADGSRVRLEVRGLSPDTQYFYRVVAVQKTLRGVDIMEWLPPPTYGETRSFTTADLAELAEIEDEEGE